MKKIREGSEFFLKDVESFKIPFLTFEKVTGKIWYTS